MSTAVFADAALASGAFFHFQKLNVELGMPSARIFAEDGALIGTPLDRGLLVHELVHYLQGVSTVLGQRILLNWMAVSVGAAQCLAGVTPLPVPMNKPEAQRETAVGLAVTELAEYFAEMNALVGAGHALRPEKEAEPHKEFSLYDYTFPHPRDKAATSAVALRLSDPSGKPFGVPILGDALTEGMAQAAQWVAAGSVVSDELLAARPCDPTPRSGAFDVYYTAIVRAVRERLPGWDPRLTTILLSDAALCSRYPGTTLAYLLDRMDGKRAPTNIEGYKNVRRALDTVATLRESRTFILEEIDHADAGLPKDGVALAPHFRRLFRLFRDAWAARAKDPAALLDDEYGASFLSSTVRSFGAPPIFFTNKSHLVALSADEELLRACYVMRACYELLLGLCIDGLSTPCSILRSQLCSHRKTDKCSSDLLSIPIDAGRACHIAFAATSLGLYGRTLRRVG